VKAYSEDHRLVYVKSMTLDNDGNPVILAVTSSDHRPGPQGDPRTWEVLHYQHHEWNIHPVTTSTNNYDTGSIWVEADGTWRIIGPTEPGPQRWGVGGEIAVWTSRDQGKTWNKVRDVTRNSPRNHSYVRKVFNADPNRRLQSCGPTAIPISYRFPDSTSPTATARRFDDCPTIWKEITPPPSQSRKSIIRSFRLSDPCFN